MKGVEYFRDAEVADCGSSEMGMHRKLPMPTDEKTRRKTPMELVHSDLCGPMKTIGYNREKYTNFWTDDCSDFIFTYYLHKKSETIDRFRKIVAFIENHTQYTIKTIRTDNGGEFKNDEFSALTNSKGIVHQTSAPHTPAQNGKAERMNGIRQHRHWEGLYDAQGRATS